MASASRRTIIKDRISFMHLILITPPTGCNAGPREGGSRETRCAAEENQSEFSAAIARKGGEGAFVAG
jgi:hypothetical protein